MPVVSSLHRSAPVAAIVLLAPATALAHTYVMQPPSRDVATANLDERAKKIGPCGGSPRRSDPTEYAPGATIEVKWQETIGHQGCFQIALSPGDDKDWITLKQVDDPPDNPDDKIYTDTVKQPAGLTCSACTLVVRQLMLEGQAVKTCGADAAPPPNDTYYSCADIRIGDFPDSGAASPRDAGGSDETPSSASSKDAGMSSSGGSSGRKVKSSPPESGGCVVVSGASSSVSTIATMTFGMLAILRRRRRARSATRADESTRLRRTPAKPCRLLLPR